MQETLELVFTYVRMVWRFRWVALVSAFLLCSAGWTYVVIIPDVYQVSTRVFLDTTTLLKPLLRGLAVDTDVHAGTADLMRRTLLVRPNLEEVARKTDMDLEAKTPEDFERMLEALREDITVSGTAKDNIYLLSYHNQDPKLATKVVEALLNIFVEKSLGENRKDTHKTRQFIDRQIAEYESRLQAAEDRLKEFKQRNFGLLPRSGANYYQRLSDATEELGDAEQRLREAKSRATILEDRLSGHEPILGLGPEYTPPPDSAPVATPFDDQLRKVQGTLDELLMQYTEKHPDVVGNRRLLESLEAKREDYLSEYAQQRRSSPQPQGAVAGDLLHNPVYQELQIEYGKASAAVAVEEERVKRQRQLIEDLQSRVDSIFRVEAELTRLNRDYSINKSNYDTLLARREALKIGEEAGQTSDSVQFNILEPPREPVLPTGPNRAQYSAGVFVLGSAAGIGIALLLAMMRPGFYSISSLRQVADVPVFGKVSRLWTRRERFKRRMEVVSFAGGCATLLGMFAGLYVLFVTGVNLQEKVMQIGQRLL